MGTGKQEPKLRWVINWVVPSDFGTPTEDDSFRSDNPLTLLISGLQIHLTSRETWSPEWV